MDIVEWLFEPQALAKGGGKLLPCELEKVWCGFAHGVAADALSRNGDVYSRISVDGNHVVYKGDNGWSASFWKLSDTLSVMSYAKDISLDGHDYHVAVFDSNFLPHRDRSLNIYDESGQMVFQSGTCYINAGSSVDLVKHALDAAIGQGHLVGVTISEDHFCKYGFCI